MADLLWLMLAFLASLFKSLAERGDEGDRREKMVGMFGPLTSRWRMRRCRGLSRRRACTLMKVACSALGYRLRRVERDGPVARMAALSAQYPRYGCRASGIFLGRDGHVMSPGQVHRLLRWAKLQVPRKRCGTRSNAFSFDFDSLPR